MGDLTFGEIYNEVRYRTGNRQDFEDPVYSDAFGTGTTNSRTRGKMWINQAYYDICTDEKIVRMFKFPELEAHSSVAMVASQTSYTLPSDCAVILSVRDHTNNLFLKKIDYRTIDRLTQYTGKPTRYARWASTLMLDPQPDSTYTMRLRYIKRPAELTAVGGFTLLPAMWDEGIILKSTAVAFDALMMQDKAMAARQTYEYWFNRRVPDMIGDTENADYGMEPDASWLGVQ